QPCTYLSRQTQAATYRTGKVGARCSTTETGIRAVVSRAKRTARWPPRRSNPAVRTNSKDNAGVGGACTRALTVCAAANRGGESQRSARHPQRSRKKEPDAAR